MLVDDGSGSWWWLLVLIDYGWCWSMVASNDIITIEIISGMDVSEPVGVLYGLFFGGRDEYFLQYEPYAGWCWMFSFDSAWCVLFFYLSLCVPARSREVNMNVLIVVFAFFVMCTCMIVLRTPFYVSCVSHAPPPTMLPEVLRGARQPVHPEGWDLAAYLQWLSMKA